MVYFCDVPAGPDIHFSTVTKDSGRLQYDSMEKMMELERAGIVDGYSMAPITKAGFHAAGLDFSSEFEVFAKFYGVPKCASVIKCENIFRSTVVGHCAFREIVERLTPDGIVDTAHALLDTMAIFLGRENCRIAVAALNPHAGEDGLFGNEEATIIQPAIDRLLAEGNQVIGVLIYTGIPANVVSVGHGPAYGKAGKGTADPKNLISSVEVLRELVLKKKT